jgi:hypothetical protein
MFTPIWTCKKGSTSTSRNYFKKITQTFYFSSIIFNMSFDSCWTLLKSCARPNAKVRLFVHLAIPCFCPPLNVFSFALWTKLGLPRPLVLGLTHYTCGQPLNPMGIHLLRYAHGGERTTSHDVIWDAFVSIHYYKMWVWFSSRHSLDQWIHCFPIRSHSL